MNEMKVYTLQSLIKEKMKITPAAAKTVNIDKASLEVYGEAVRQNSCTWLEAAPGRTAALG